MPIFKEYSHGAVAGEDWGIYGYKQGAGHPEILEYLSHYWSKSRAIYLVFVRGLIAVHYAQNIHAHQVMNGH